MDNISKAAADYILKELYELARNEFITSSELYQVMDKFIRSLVSEPVEDEFRPFIIHHLDKDKYEIFPLETNEEIAKRLFEEWKEWFFDSSTKQIDLMTFIPWLDRKK